MLQDIGKEQTLKNANNICTRAAHLGTGTVSILFTVQEEVGGFRIPVSLLQKEETVQDNFRSQNYAMKRIITNSEIYPKLSKKKICDNDRVQHYQY